MSNLVFFLYFKIIVGNFGPKLGNQAGWYVIESGAVTRHFFLGVSFRVDSSFLNIMLFFCSLSWLAKQMFS